jgi:CheY-like chemotaxis protein
MAHQLIGLLGGTLEISPVQGREQVPAVTLVLSVAQQITVLMIDDNADTLQLFERRLSESRYRFIGARDPEQALDLAEEMAPQIILLDVMLPDVDGWELLGRLREHPATRDAPILICTILPQEQLALTLGAAAFIRKPVSREALLSALDHVSQLRESC